ncbi:MAG TPA: MFS transporter [Longimicrobiales bacterium]|nr:MFS transporter [Longimicrobiales bacterium]
MSAQPTAAQARRAVTAAVVGNVLEWYDFAVYSFLAGIIGQTFFPSGDPSAELLASFAVFGVGFLARPLGGVVIGRLGDVKGRKTALLVTIFLMAAGTVLMGLAPSYAAVGVAGPTVIVIARLMQGFSAGGEWGGSTAFIVEWAPEGRRGWYGSFQQMSVAAGLLLGSGTAALLSSVMSAENMEAWGWRIPFLLGGLLGPVGLWMRRTLEETPAYRAAQREPAPVRAKGAVSPVTLAARAFGFTVLWTVSYYIFLNYMPSFTERYASLSRSQALWSNTVGLLVLVAVIPLWGRLSDRVGRRPLLLACCAAFVVLPYPVASFLASGPSFGAIMALQVFMAVIIALFSGTGPAAIAEIFPTRSRSTWMTIGYAFAVAIFGGFAPYIATWLIRETGSPIAWVYYVMLAAVISGAVIYSLEETAHRPLR